MKDSIFDFTDYKAYLKLIIRKNPNLGHGFKSKMAKALQCQTAYVSQVLNRDANFSLEQAEEVNLLLKHTRDEGKFFLLMVQKTRAGTIRLRKRFEEEMLEILTKREKLRERIEKYNSLSLESQMRYYSRWYYAAIHMTCMIPEMQNKETIAKALGLPIATVGEVLEFLLKEGLLVFDDGRYTAGITRLFLGNDSPMIAQMHANWRVRAMQSLAVPAERDLHYSTCATLSKKDFRTIKDRFIELINENHTLIENSKEEELCNITIDFYSLFDSKASDD